MGRIVRDARVHADWFLSQKHIANDSALVFSGAKEYHVGIPSSAMHMVWLRCAGGRRGSRYQYASHIVYNNFHWTTGATKAQRERGVEYARKVLAVRQGYLDAGQTLADLYDPLYMLSPLLKAHQALDRAVDRCYRREKFESERERVKFLFQVYEKLTAPLAPTPVVMVKRRGRRTANLEFGW